jgi:hypothetical protein
MLVSPVYVPGIFLCLLDKTLVLYFNELKERYFLLKPSKLEQGAVPVEKALPG